MFSQKKAVYFKKWRPQKIAYIFLYFRIRKPRKNFSYFSKRNFSYISRKVYSEPRDEALLIFQERNIQNTGIMELSYISGNGTF